jgi:hypothetical protein
MHYHLKSHENRLAYECNYCKVAFKAQYSLDVHINTQHSQDTLHMCQVQGCQFKGSHTKSNLLIHVVRIHCKAQVATVLQKEDGVYRCLQCSTDFKSDTAFYYHVANCLGLVL